MEYFGQYLTAEVFRLFPIKKNLSIYTLAYFLFRYNYVV